MARERCIAQTVIAESSEIIATTTIASINVNADLCIRNSLVWDGGSRATGIPLAVQDDTIQTNPKRQREARTLPSLTLRVGVNRARDRYNRPALCA
jgi:hypothetical protein